MKASKKHFLSIFGGTLSVIAGIAAPVAVVSSSSKYQDKSSKSIINTLDANENINAISQDILIEKRRDHNFVKLKKNFSFFKKGIFLKLDLKIKITKDASQIGHLRNGDKILLSATPKRGFRFSDNNIKVISREITITNIGDNDIPHDHDTLTLTNRAHENSLSKDLDISDYQSQNSWFFKAISTNKILIQNNTGNGFKPVTSFYSIKLHKNSINKIELNDNIKKYFKSKLNENIHIEIGNYLESNFNSEANDPEEQFVTVSFWNKNHELHSDPFIIFVQTLNPEKGNIRLKETGVFQKNNSLSYKQNSNQPDYIKNDYEFNSTLNDIPASIVELENDVNKHFESSSGRIAIEYLGSKKMSPISSPVRKDQFNNDTKESRSYLFRMLDKGSGVQNNEDVKLLQIMHADKIIFSSNQSLNEQFDSIVAHQSEQKLQLFRNNLTREKVESIIKNNFKSIHGSQLQIEWSKDYNGNPNYKNKIMHLKIKTINNEIIIPKTINYVVEIIEANTDDQISISPKDSSSDMDIYSIVPCQEKDADFIVNHQELDEIILPKALKSLTIGKTHFQEKVSLIDTQTTISNVKTIEDSNGDKFLTQYLSLSYLGHKTGLKKTVKIKFIGKIVDEPSINFKENSSIGGTVLKDGAAIFHKIGQGRTIQWYKKQIKEHLVYTKADNSEILIVCDVSDSEFEKIISSQKGNHEITFTATAFGFAGKGVAIPPRKSIEVRVKIKNELSIFSTNSSFVIDWPEHLVENKVTYPWHHAYLKINNYKYTENQNDLSEIEKNDIKKQINWYRDDQIKINIINDKNQTFSKQMSKKGYVEYNILITNDEGEKIKEIDFYVYK